MPRWPNKNKETVVEMVEFGKEPRKLKNVFDLQPLQDQLNDNATKLAQNNSNVRYETREMVKEAVAKFEHRLSLHAHRIELLERTQPKEQTILDKVKAMFTYKGK